MTTMLVDTPSKTRLGVGLDTEAGRRKDPEAWKRALGTKQIPARLAMLPEGESRLKRVGVSAILQIILVAFFVSLPLFFPERLKTAMNWSVVPIAMPVTEVPVAPPPPVVKPKI